jgi:hypothetical protein
MAAPYFPSWLRSAKIPKVCMPPFAQLRETGGLASTAAAFAATAGHKFPRLPSFVPQSFPFNT